MSKSVVDFSEIERAMMRRALALATQAAAAGEVPVGAVIYTTAGEVVAEGHNETLTGQDITAHAEMQALRRACGGRKNHRLPDLRMAVTLEPCPMCAGALFQARLASLIFAAADDKTGACGGVVDLAAQPRLNHHTRVRSGLYAVEAAGQLRQFFQQRR